MLNILVCFKQIQNPELASELFQINQEETSVIPTGQSLVMSPFDEQAIEAALRIRDKVGDARITVATVGPASFQPGIKHALSMGADEGILVSDEGLGKLDPYDTASVLCAAVKKAGPFDLVITGRQAADTDAGIVGCGIAELLGIPIISFAKDVRVEGDRLFVERVLDGGSESVEAILPCVVTIANELGTPRKPSLRETMRASKKPQSVWKAQGLGCSQEMFGRMHTRKRLFKPTRVGECELITGVTPVEIAERLATRLADIKLI